MNIRLRKKLNQYAQVHKNLLFNDKLSIQAKGLGSILECYSDDFEITMRTLEIHTNLHKDTLRKYIKELEKNYFLFRIQIIKNCQIIWFFDSENIDLYFLINEVEKIKTNHKIRFLTAYEIFLTGKTGTEKLAPYNNTNNSTQIFSDKEALTIMYEAEQKKRKRGSEKKSNNNYYKKYLTNTPRFNLKNEIEF